MKLTSALLRFVFMTFMIFVLGSCGSDDDPDKTGGSALLGNTIGNGFGAVDTVRDVSIDHNGNIFATSKTKIYKVDAAGNATVFAGSDVDKVVDGKGTGGGFKDIDAISFDESNSIYLFDSASIRKVTSDGTVSSIKITGDRYTLESRSDRTYLSFQTVIAKNGDIYFPYFSVLLKRPKDTTEVRLFAGDPDFGNGLVDGAGSNAKFQLIEAMTLTPDGNSIVLGDRAAIRSVSLADSTVMTYAGSEKEGIKDGTAKEATFNFVGDVAIDASGNYYVSDYNRIRKISTSGDVTTIAGPYKPDGKLFKCGGIAIDKDSHFLYIADMTKAGSLVKIDLTAL